MLEHRRRNSSILFSTATRHRTHHTHITPPRAAHFRVPRGLRFDGDGEVGSRIGPRGGVLEAGGGCDGHGGGVTVLRWCEPRDQAVLGVEGWGWKVKHTQGWVELGGVVDWEAARWVHPWLIITPRKSCPLSLHVQSSSLLPPPSSLILLPYPVLCLSRPRPSDLHGRRGRREERNAGGGWEGTPYVIVPDTVNTTETDPRLPRSCPGEVLGTNPHDRSHSPTLTQPFATQHSS